jgi:hypothetical protein
MKLLTYTLLVVLLCTFAHGQNIGLVTDTNGTVVSSRTNPLTFTNDIRIGQLTNATGPNLVVASTNGTLSTGSVPSGGAPEGAVLTVVGGQYAGVASRTVTQALTNDQTKTSWTTNSINQAGNTESSPLSSWTIDAGATYEVKYRVRFESDITNAIAHGIVLPAYTNYAPQTAGIGTTAGNSISVITSTTNATQMWFPFPWTPTGGSQTNRSVSGSFIFRSEADTTMVYSWCPGSNITNPILLKAGAVISVTKIAP